MSLASMNFLRFLTCVGLSSALTNKQSKSCLRRYSVICESLPLVKKVFLVILRTLVREEFARDSLRILSRHYS